MLSNVQIGEKVTIVVAALLKDTELRDEDKPVVKAGVDLIINLLCNINDIANLENNMSLATYINLMKNQNTWGSAVELKSFCNMFNLIVHVHFDNRIIEFLPESKNIQGVINILYTGNHYEPIPKIS